MRKHGLGCILEIRRTFARRHAVLGLLVLQRLSNHLAQLLVKQIIFFCVGLFLHRLREHNGILVLVVFFELVAILRVILFRIIVVLFVVLFVLVFFVSILVITRTQSIVFIFVIVIVPILIITCTQSIVIIFVIVIVILSVVAAAVLVIRAISIRCAVVLRGIVSGPLELFVLCREHDWRMQNIWLGRGLVCGIAIGLGELPALLDMDVRLVCGAVLLDGALCGFPCRRELQARMHALECIVDHQSELDREHWELCGEIERKMRQKVVFNAVKVAQIVHLGPKGLKHGHNHACAERVPGRIEPLLLGRRQHLAVAQKQKEKLDIVERVVEKAKIRKKMNLGNAALLCLEIIRGQPLQNLRIQGIDNLDIDRRVEFAQLIQQTRNRWDALCGNQLEPSRAQQNPGLNCRVAAPGQCEQSLQCVLDEETVLIGPSGASSGQY
eukprot:comp23128_c0_seq1/m.58330 comp23128_c0_seq1/g.58330  ORF comp23128_c0_seq1/g.58330 comp23128_c0_seq1/m.58330 type:complete len:440 (-) comp23128_c0_seq1:413-1732(-)